MMILFPILFGIATAYVGRKDGRIFWFVTGVLFGPFGLAAAMIKSIVKAD